MFSFVEPSLAELILGSVRGLAAEAILVVSVAGLVTGIGAALFSRSSIGTAARSTTTTSPFSRRSPALSRWPSRTRSSTRA